MASKAKRLRRRQERAQAAQKTQLSRVADILSDGGSALEGFVPLAYPIYEVPLDQKPADIPDRAPCPFCGYSQKVNKGGLMGKHNRRAGRGELCSGSGEPYNS